MAPDWRFYQEQEERRLRIVRGLEVASQARIQREKDAYRLRRSAESTKTLPTYPAVSWGALGLGGLIVFGLELIALFIVASILSWGIISLTSRPKSHRSVPPKVAPRHKGHHHPGKEIKPPFDR